MRSYAHSQVRYTAAMKAMALTKQESTSEWGRQRMQVDLPCTFALLALIWLCIQNCTATGPRSWLLQHCKVRDATKLIAPKPLMRCSPTCLHRKCCTIGVYV